MKIAVVSCFDTFSERLEALRRFFIQRGDDVSVFLSDFSHRSKTYRTDDLSAYYIVHAKAYSKNLSIARMRSHAVFASSFARILEEETWDLVWVIVPPNSLVKQCAKFRRRHPETKLVFDVNDLWPESLPVGGMGSLPPMRYWKCLRDRFLPDGDFVVTECALFQKKLNLTQSSKSRVLYLCKAEDQTEAPRACLSDNRLELCYLGSINNIIDLDAISAILTQLGSIHPVTLHIIGSGERETELVDCAQKSGARVIFHGAVFDTAEKQAVFDRCHFGLNVMKSSVCVGLTMKSLDYLAGGLPLINTIPGDTWDLVEQYGFGLNWSNEASLPQMIKAFDHQAARNKARTFFEQQLSYASFARGVEAVLQAL